MSDPVIIPGFIDEWGRHIADFEIGNEHTKFEWLMIYTGRHPTAFLGPDSRTPTAEFRKHRLGLIGADGSNVPRALPPLIEPVDILWDERFRVVRPTVRIIPLAPTKGSDWDDRAVYRLGNELYHLSKAWTPRREVYLDDDPGTVDDTVCLFGPEWILEIARKLGNHSEYITRLMPSDASALPATSESPQRRAWQIAKSILSDFAKQIADNEVCRSVLLHRGWRKKLDLQVHEKMKDEGYKCGVDVVRKAIVSSRQNWEKENLKK